MTRRALDALYEASLWLSSLCIVLMGSLVLVQILGRILDRAALAIGARPPGMSVSSLAEIGGFLFVAAATLGLAGTFRAAGHVRVTLLTGNARPRAERGLLLVALAGAIALAAFAAWNAGLQAYDSWVYGSVSFGMVRIPLWGPQTLMTIGFAVFLIALVDDFVAIVSGREPAFRISELAKSRAGAPDEH